MKTTSVIFLLCVLVFTGCAPVLVPTLPPGVVETAVAKTIAAQILPTTEIQPTRTSLSIDEPAPAFSAASLEILLRENGYKRQPFTTIDNEQGYSWFNGSNTVFYTYPDRFEIEILDDQRDLKGRVDRMNKSLDMVASLFAPGFIADLKNEMEAYSRETPFISGEPKVLYEGDGDLMGRLYEYNGKDMVLRNGSEDIPLRMSLQFQEYKCDPSLYEYCYFGNMPNMTYSGDASLTFFDILIKYPTNLSNKQGG
jgi:hypothetical protein